MKRSPTRRQSHVVYRGEVPYVRCQYPDGSGRRKERRLFPGDQVELVYAQLYEEILTELKAPQSSSQINTIGELLSYYVKEYKPIPKWYQSPILTTQISYRPNVSEQIVTMCLADVLLSTLETISGYDILLSFKRARANVLREDIKKVFEVSAKGRRIVRREVTQVERKPATIHREVEVLRRLLIYAVQRGWLSRNPFNAGPPLINHSIEESRDRLPTAEEEAAILAHCTGKREHLRGFLITLGETGLRPKWLCKLRWPMVCWDDGLIDTCTLQKEQKRNKKFPRFIGMTQVLKSELSALYCQWQAGRAANPALDDRIFPFREYKKAYATACALAGVTGLRVYDWRHRFATHAIAAGVPKPLAMKATGHKQEQTFDIYLNLDAQMARALARKLDQARQHSTHLSLTTPLTLERELPDGQEMVLESGLLIH
jgi:integrase